jgi:hypothetical protein
MPRTKNTKITADVADDIRRRFNRFAVKSGLKKSSIVTFALEAYLTAHGG